MNFKNKNGSLIDHLNKTFTYHSGIYKAIDDDGYWSNFTKQEQENLFKMLETFDSRQAIKKLFPQFYDTIFGSMRNVGLPLLEMKENEVGIDYGCLWGNMLLYASKNCKEILGVDQTMESLKFVQKRIKEEGINNCYLLNANIRSKLNLQSQFDFAIVNGVLEWVPETSKVEVENFHSFDTSDKVNNSEDVDKKTPRLIQKEFLVQVNSHLKENGRLYLAIENRFDYQYFLWRKDPHVGLMYTSFLPRFISNIISYIFRRRPYRTYIYSKNKLVSLLKEAGFSSFKIYTSFPSYQTPLKILSYGEEKDLFEPEYLISPKNDFFRRLFRFIRRSFDLLIIKKLGWSFFAPAFIIIAKKK